MSIRAQLRSAKASFKSMGHPKELEHSSAIGCLHDIRLAGYVGVRHRFQDEKLTWREAMICDAAHEQLVGKLARTVQKIEW